MYNGIYTAQVASTAIAAGFVLIELQVPANVQIEIIRFWMGAAEGDNPVDEIQEIEIYGNDAAATGGAGMTEQVIQGAADQASAITALTGPAQGATETRLYRDAYHTQNGWLYSPLEDERIRVVGGTVIDNVGVSFPVSPDQSMTVSFGITWGELG